MKRKLHFFWENNKHYVKLGLVATATAWYADHADVFHSEPALGLLRAGQESTDNVDVIGAFVKGIACFFGVC